MAITNRKHGLLDGSFQRLASADTRARLGSPADAEMQVPRERSGFAPSEEIRQVVKALESVERICAGLIERIEGAMKGSSSSSPSDVSQCSIENTENACRLSSEEPTAVGRQIPTPARETTPELRQIAPLPAGLIDLTSEGSCDSTISPQAGQEAAPDSARASGPSAPSTQSPSATPPNSQHPKFPEVLVLSDDEDGDCPAKSSLSGPGLQPEVDLAPKLVFPSPNLGATTNDAGPAPSPKSGSCPTPSTDRSMEDDGQVVPPRDGCSSTPSSETATEDRGQFVSHQTASFTTPQNAASVRVLEQGAPTDLPMRTPYGAPEEQEARRLTQMWVSAPLQTGGDCLGSLWEGLSQSYAVAGVDQALPLPEGVNNSKLLAGAKKRKAALYSVNGLDPQPIQCSPGGNGLQQVEAPPSPQATKPRGRPRKDAVQEKALFGSREVPDTANARKSDEHVLPTAGIAQTGVRFPGAEDAHQLAEAWKAADNSHIMDRQPLAEAETKAKTGDKMDQPLPEEVTKAKTGGKIDHQPPVEAVTKAKTATKGKTGSLYPETHVGEQKPARAAGAGKGRAKGDGLLEDEFDEEDEGERGAEPVEEDVEISPELRKLYVDEKTDYVPYTRRYDWEHESPSVRQRQVDEDDVDVPELVRKMEAATFEVAQPEAPGNGEGDGKCPHTNFDFDEEANWYYCCDCGSVDIEIPTLEEKKPKLEEKKSAHCVHMYDFREDIGSYCAKCGLVRMEIEKMFVLEMQKAARKQVKKVEGSQAAATGEEQQVQLPLHPGSSLKDSNCSDFELHPHYKDKLHPHQKKGFKFLSENLFGSGNSMGCVLAHAPGTGKTLLMISFIESFLSKFKKGRPLILAPKIMLRSWCTEFQRWAVKDIPIYGINGRVDRAEAVLEEGEDEETRATTSSYMKKARDRVLREWEEGGQAGAGGVLLMSYTMFALLVSKLVSNGSKEKSRSDRLDVRISMVLLNAPNLVVLDEGHLARNEKTKISQALLAMETKRRVLLSGSLFHNNFKELFTLFRLCRGDFMAKHPQFRKKIEASGVAARKNKKELMNLEERIFNEEIADKLQEYADWGNMWPEEIEPVVMKMQTLTAPFVDWYQGEILKSLPGLVEYAVVMNLTAAQKALIDPLPNKKSMSRQTKVTAICVHPALRERWCDEPRDLGFRELNAEGASLDKEAKKGVKVCFVVQLLELLSQACKRPGKPEKLLIFCSTLAPLNYLEQLLVRKWKWTRGVEVMRLDGKMQDSDRQDVMQKFNNEKRSCRVMLASIKACKEGISLTAASRVVILDNQDNPAVARQAVSRAYRIGQTRKVVVYRLVTTQEDEAFYFNRAVNKDRLSQVLQDPVATMARLGGFLREQTSHDVEDEILKQLMRNDRDNTRYINTVYKYNACGDSACGQSGPKSKLSGGRERH